MHMQHGSTGVRAFFIIVVLLAAARAAAQQPSHPDDTSFSINLFEPAPGPGNFFAVEGPGVGDDMTPSVGLLFYYQHRPFVLLNCDADGNCGDDVVTGDRARTVDLVENLMIAEINASLTFLRRFQVGLAVPLTVWQRGEGYTVEEHPVTGGEWLEPSGETYQDDRILGDLRLHLKARILGDELADGPLLSVSVIPSLPLAHWIGRGDGGFSGDSMLSVTAPRIAFGYRAGPFRTAVNAGVKWRESSELFSAEVGHQLTYGVGLGYAVIPEVEILAEVYGAKGLVTENFTDIDTAPLLYMGGVRFRAGDFTINAAAGGGILSGVGVPQVQVLGGVAWAPREEYDPTVVVCPAWDRDCDGIPNDVDMCPDDPEDFDGYEDDDGCPDPDNDQDGIPDGYDSCPNDPEDYDGFEDEDGCPDPDNDGDGICDPWVAEMGLLEKYAHICTGYDLCPDEPEDFDGFEDEDGCPDPDNDGDGICDPWVAEQGLLEKYAHICTGIDHCPNDPEDFDGFEDDDGCPDFDNDNDGIPDVDDMCPDEPGTLTGVNDDGCPRKGPQLVVITEDRIELTQQVQFRTNSDEIVGARSFEMLDIVARVLAGNPIVRVSIAGHTDDRGPARRNRELSQRRADSVKAYLAKQGVAEGRMDTKGYGPDNPIESNRTAQGRAANRRVEFVVIRPEKVVITPKKKEVDPDAMDFTVDEEPTMDFTADEEVESMDFTAE